jgi:hypothetical protein
MNNQGEYISQVRKEQLLTCNYQHLTPTVANNKNNQCKDILTNAFHEYKHLLTQTEINCSTRSFKGDHWIPIFYGITKVHKSLIKLLPVVSCVNSFNFIFSNWIDSIILKTQKLSWGAMKATHPTWSKIIHYRCNCSV